MPWPSRLLLSTLAVAVACGVGEDGGGGVETFGGATSAASGTATEAGPGSGSDGSTASDATTEPPESGEESSTFTPQPVECEATQTQCGALCTDLASDPNNCGDCGISCVVANATPSCTGGVCAMGACDLGFIDCDASIANGCESTTSCGGEACVTECGSASVTSCPDGCTTVCVPPVEACNASDDNCDGLCDEGPIDGCRIGVHRSYGGAMGHFYTTDLAAASAGGFTLEFANFFYLYSEQGPSMQPLHHCTRSGGRHFYTADNGCEGLGGLADTLGFFSPTEVCGAAPLYRMHNTGSDTHFYTTSETEWQTVINTAGWADEGILGYIWPAP